MQHGCLLKLENLNGEWSLLCATNTRVQHHIGDVHLFPFAEHFLTLSARLFFFSGATFFFGVFLL